MILTLTVPFPVSTNQYWRSVQGRALISKKGRLYTKSVARAVEWQRGNKHLKDRLKVEVQLFPPDNRRRDVDNFGGKSLLDALQKAGVYDDDSQIDKLVIKRMGVEKGGLALVKIQTIEAGHWQGGQASE